MPWEPIDAHKERGWVPVEPDPVQMPSTPLAVTRAIGQGMPFVGTFTDEAEALARSLIGDKSYSEEHKRIKEQEKRYAEENPYVQGATTIGTGLVSGGLLAKQLIGAAPKLLQVMGYGAAEGAALGAGAAEDSRLLGAAGGAVLGGVMPAVVEGVRRTATKVPAAAKRLLKGTHTTPEQARIEASTVIDDLAEQARRLSPGISETTPGGTVADVMGDYGAAMTRQTASMSDDAMSEGQRLIQRESRAAGRAEGKLMEALKVNQHAADKYKTLMESRLAPSRDQAYAVLKEVSPEATDALEEVLTRPGAMAKYREMQDIAERYFGETLPPLYETVDDLGEGFAQSLYDQSGRLGGLIGEAPSAPPKLNLEGVTISTFDKMKKTLDKMVKGETTVTGYVMPKGEGFKRLANDLVKETNSPEWNKARTLAQDIIERREAFDAGKAFAKESPYNLLDYVKGATPGQKEALKAGAASTLNAVKGGREGAGGLMDFVSSPDNVRRVNAVFGKKSADSLVDFITTESRFKTTEGAYRTGLKDAMRRTAKEATDVENLEMDLPRAYSKSGVALAVAQKTLDRVLGAKVAPETVDALGKALMAPASDFRAIRAFAAQAGVKQAEAKALVNTLRNVASPALSGAGIRALDQQ